MSAAWLSRPESHTHTLDNEKITADNEKLKESEIRTLGTAQRCLHTLFHT